MIIEMIRNRLHNNELKMKQDQQGTVQHGK
jgi:hypothetical protein